MSARRNKSDVRKQS